MADQPEPESPRPRGRPRADEPGSAVSAWIPVVVYERLMELSRATGRTVCDLVRGIILCELNGASEFGDIASSRTHVYVGGPPSTRLKRMQLNQETRARRLGIRWSMVDLRRVYDYWKGICGVCGLPVNAETFTVDHIVPVSRGGAHVFENLQPAHSGCNSQKGAR